jgi:Pyruvate/2-oxoacid:ferredoxin oxidoreductase delta subunit
MLADLALAAPPDLSILDGVVAMEGPGPNNGSPKKLDLLLASRDPLALDWVAAQIMGYESASIPYLGDLMGRPAAEGSVRGRWVATPAEIELSGLSLAEARPEHFERVPVVAESLIAGSRVPGLLHRALKSVMLPRPVFDHAKCVRCGACIKICPAKALGQAKGPSSKIVIDYASCLRCYCCHEVCPEDAIRLVRRPF